ncbi:MAG TPA: ABC transporter permease [Mycobacteriales bacterium]|nr:ABC transporter permease [Mycobacteriales bacterium]
MITSVRVFFIGGITSYRALFTWLSPWILIPTFIVTPLFQVLFFAYVGQDAGVADNRFFVIGNAVQYVAIPCLFAMGNTIGGERRQQTLGLLLVTPARRIPLFLGRSVPVIANGVAVTVVALVAGAALLRVHVAGATLPDLLLCVIVASFSCTGMGLITAALALRVRETAVLVNIVFGILLIFCGVNVPLSSLPLWMRDVAAWLPLTHAIAAARRASVGVGFAGIRGDLGEEALLGIGYVAIGLLLLAYFERESRQRATLDAF